MLRDAFPYRLMKQRKRSHHAYTTKIVLLADSHARAHYGTAKLRPVHTALVPTANMNTALRSAYHVHIPHTITSATPAPPSLRHENRYPDASLWAAARDHEINHLNSQQAILWHPPTEVPVGQKTIRLAMTYKYTRSDTSEIYRSKVRFSLHGDLMRPTLHCDPNDTVAYAVENYTIRALYDLAAVRQHPLHHLDNPSAFKNEI